MFVFRGGSFKTVVFFVCLIQDGRFVLFLFKTVVFFVFIQYGREILEKFKTVVTKMYTISL